MNTRGAATLLIVGVLALLGVGGWGLSKTKWFHGESKRAAESTKTTDDLLAAQQKQGAVAAASVAKIGEANAVAPDSPSKAFISREVPVALASLPAPDVQALIEAERRKAAILEGRLQEADKLYGVAMQKADEYQKEAQRAIAAKRASDMALEQAAAESRGAEQQAFWFMLVAGAAVVLYIWTKLSHVSPLTLSAAVQDIRNGTAEANPAIASLDSALTPFQQANTRLMAWFRGKLAKVTS